MPTHAHVANVLQVLNYDDFVSKPLSKKPEHMSAFNSSDHSHDVSVNCTSMDNEAPIAILNTSLTGIGPQQCEILQVQTTDQLVYHPNKHFYPSALLLVVTNFYIPKETT